MKNFYFNHLLALFVLFFSGTLSAQVNYSVVDSDPNNPGITINSYSNHIVRDSEGNIYVAYGISTNQTTHWYCFIRKSTDGGASWENAVRLESFPDSSNVTSLSIDSGDNLMVGMSFNVGSFFAMSRDKGATWSTALQLLDGGWGTWDWMPSIVVDSKDVIHAGFHAQYGWQQPPSNIFYASSEDGTSFSQPLNITKIPQDAQYGNGAGPANLQIGKNDEIFVMTGDGKTNDSDSYNILLQYSNNQWSEPIILNDTNTYGAGGDFVIHSNGLLHIFIAQLDPITNKRRIVYKTFDAATKTLSSIGTLTESDENVMNISAGIYENDEILVAYDIYDSTTKNYQGVFLKRSSDAFSKIYGISETAGARNPNLRSYTYNMHQKDKMDIVWVEPDTVAGGEMIAYYEISGGIKTTGKAKIDVFVPYFMNPGQEVTFVARYGNNKGEDITNAAIVMDVPSDLIFLNASEGGTYKDREGSPQVFWKLNTLKDQSKGTVFAKFYIPWGMPSASGKIVANLIGDNIFSNYDTTKYYQYEQRDLTGQKDLSQAEVDKILESNKDLKDLLNYSISLGYLWNNVAQDIYLSNSTTIKILYLMDPVDFSPLMIKKVEDLPVFAEQIQWTRYTRFDVNGGYTTNSSTGEFISFGRWAESHSLTEARCQLNCTINKVPGWIGEAASKTYNMASTGLNCASCAKSKGKETADCINCLNAYKDVPGVSYTVDVAQCLKDCLENPNLHICTEDKKYCNWSVIGYMSGVDTVFTTRCNKTTGTYDPVDRRTYCAYGEKCVNGECKAQDNDPCKADTIIAPAAELAICKLDDFEIVPAHDPNAISVSPDGDILPEETLTYTIEFENTGSGTAYDVFILNELDENLDDSTLKINDNGTYSSTSRLLKWQIGQLEAGQKGSVSYNIKPRSGLKTGAVISNFAEVHFPSAGEVTPTNIVASRINSIRAENKSITINPGETEDILLSGKDQTNSNLNYRIVTYPKYGSLSGTPPNMKYKASNNFVGMDRFTYTAISNNVESNPATISIEIKGTDTTPPSVIRTSPKDKEENVGFSVVTEPDQTYLPVIFVQFDEDIMPETVQTYNFYLKENGEIAINSIVEYDSQNRIVKIKPLIALKPYTNYELTVSYITDKSDNMILEPYIFTFRTVAEKALSVSLSDNNSLVDFGKVVINSGSIKKTVSLNSIGISAVNISDVKLSQSGKEFSISEEKCSNVLLDPLANCHITIEFKPSTLGTKTAEINITSDDSNNTTIKIPVKGEVVEAQISDAGTDTASTNDAGSTSTDTKDNGGCGCNYLE